MATKQFQNFDYSGETIVDSNYKMAEFESEAAAETNRSMLNVSDITPPSGYELDHVESSHSQQFVGGTELLPLIYWFYFFKVYWRLIKM